MKKILIFSSTILLIIFILFLNLNHNINLNITQNKEILESLNQIILKQDIALADESENTLPSFEINKIDYIGIITIKNLSLPVKSKCSNSYLSIESACTYSKKPFIVLATTLKDSLPFFKDYDINDQIQFTSTLDQTFQYKITKITRIANLKDISQYNEDFIIAIKNYYNMEYILLICKSY